MFNISNQRPNLFFIFIVDPEICWGIIIWHRRIPGFNIRRRADETIFLNRLFSYYYCNVSPPAISTTANVYLCLNFLRQHFYSRLGIMTNFEILNFSKLGSFKVMMWMLLFMTSILYLIFMAQRINQLIQQIALIHEIKSIVKEVAVRKIWWSPLHCR